MALKPATDYSADAAYTYVAVQTEPKIGDIRTGEQKRTADGVPQWTVDAIRKDPAGSSALISVTIESETEPAVTGPVHFEGLRVGLWHQQERNASGLYWKANKVAASGGGKA